MENVSGSVLCLRLVTLKTSKPYSSLLGENRLYGVPFDRHRFGIVDLLPHGGWSDDETWLKSVRFLCRKLFGSRTCCRGREGDQERDDCCPHFELLAYVLSCNVYKKKISSIKLSNWIEAEVGQLRRGVANLRGTWMIYKFHIIRKPPPIAQHLFNSVLRAFLSQGTRDASMRHVSCFDI
jgi:hypothetical protein